MLLFLDANGINKETNLRSTQCLGVPIGEGGGMALRYVLEGSEEAPHELRHAGYRTKASLALGLALSGVQGQSLV